MSDDGTQTDQQHAASAPCQRLEVLDLRQAAGEPLTAEEREFSRDHRAQCEACRVEARALGLLALDRDAGPDQPLDQLSRQRWINDIVAQAEGRVAPVEAPRRARWSRTAMAVAASAVLGIGAALLAAHLTQAPGARPSPAAARTGAALDLPLEHDVVEARVLLHTGKVTLDGTPMAAARPVVPGQTLQVNGGRVALQLPMGSKVLVGDHSALQLEQVAAGRVALRLQRGVLLASVTRRSAGQEFSVQTQSGRVVVRGTRFALGVQAQRTVLRVLQGRVMVQEPGARPRTLRPGQSTTLGDPARAVRRLSRARRRSLDADSRLLELLGNGSQGASVRISSHPSGAAVRVDGTLVGTTPVVAAMRSGRRVLALRRRGFTTLRETLELRPGDVLLREYQLSRRVVVAAAPRPKAAPFRGNPAGSTKAAPPTAAERLRLKELEQQVSSLKEKVFRSKEKINQLHAVATGRSLSGVRLTVKHHNRMGRKFKLVRVEYALDGAQVMSRVDASGALDRQRQLSVLDRALTPGSHTLGVRLVFRGRGYGLFPYFKGYKFDVRSSHTFTTAAGQHTTVQVTAHEQGGITTRIEDLPAVKFKVDQAKLGR